MKKIYKIENGLAQVGEHSTIPEGFKEYTIGEEPSELTIALSNQLNIALIVTKIEEAKEFLRNTDHKDFPRYVPKPDEDMEAIHTKREEAREFIRMNR